MHRKILSGTRRARKSTAPLEQDYWLSYSDLMAGLLMVFALMLMVAVYHYTERLRSQSEELEARTAELDKRIIVIEGTMISMEAREQVIDSVQAYLDRNPSANIEIDSVTAMIRLNDQILFEEERSDLLPAGRQALDGFLGEILPIILEQDSFVAHLDEIIVEGHTNDNGDFDYNLELSQRRAFTVMSYLLLHAPPKYREILEKHMTANGRSESWPVCLDGRVRFYTDPDCRGVDKELSRRIELRFRLDDDDVLRQVKTVLFSPASPKSNED